MSIRGDTRLAGGDSVWMGVDSIDCHESCSSWWTQGNQCSSHEGREMGLIKNRCVAFIHPPARIQLANAAGVVGSKQHENRVFLGMVFPRITLGHGVSRQGGGVWSSGPALQAQCQGAALVDGGAIKDTAAGGKRGAPPPRFSWR